jgi:hypothetical protein
MVRSVACSSVLTTTRVAGPDGLSGKAEIEKAGRSRRADLESTRELWEDLANAHLERAGQGARIDRRSLAAQGIEREPTQHLGPAIVGFERRTGIPSDVRQRQAAEASARLIVARALGEIERQGLVVERSVLDLSGDLAAATLARDQRRGDEAVAEREAGERDRLARMMAAELREEIRCLRPPRVEDAVAARPEVVSMQRIVLALDAEQQASRRAVERAGRESEEWAAAHPARTRMHELGLANSAYLAERVAAYDAGTVALATLRSQREVAEAAATRVRETARRAVAQEQAPVLATLDVLEGMHQAKLHAERLAAQQQRERESGVKAFTDLAAKRERGAYGYDGAGRAWQALGEGVREAVDAYNRQAPEGRASVRDTLRAEKGQAWLAQAMPARDRGMGR